MRGYSRLKVFCWIFLVLTDIHTVCPMLNKLPDQSRNFHESVEKNMESLTKGEDVNIYEQSAGVLDNILDYIFPSISPINAQQDVKENIEDKTTFNLWNGIQSVFLGLDMGVWMYSASRLIYAGFSLQHIVIFIVTSIWATQPIPYEEQISSAVMNINKTYLEKFWSYLPFLTEEVVVVPPPDENLCEKVCKRILPEIDMKNYLNQMNVKEILENVSEKIGFSQSSFMLVIILSVVTSLLVQFFFDNVTEEGNEKFSDEELLMENVEDPVLRTIMYEWLTPTRHMRHGEGNGDNMETTDITAPTPQISPIA